MWKGMPALMAPAVPLKFMETNEINIYRINVRTCSCGNVVKEGKMVLHSWQLREDVFDLGRGPGPGDVGNFPECV